MTALSHRSGLPEPEQDDLISRIDGQIRPGLRKAFPLPDNDERFHQLLDALAGLARPAGRIGHPVRP